MLPRAVDALGAIPEDLAVTGIRFLLVRAPTDQRTSFRARLRGAGDSWCNPPFIGARRCTRLGAAIYACARHGDVPESADCELLVHHAAQLTRAGALQRFVITTNSIGGASALLETSLRYRLRNVKTSEPSPRTPGPALPTSSADPRSPNDEQDFAVFAIPIPVVDRRWCSSVRIAMTVQAREGVAFARVVDERDGEIRLR